MIFLTRPPDSCLATLVLWRLEDHVRTCTTYSQYLLSREPRIWATIDGDDSKHIEESITGKTNQWINKMRNVHLGWVVYRFKLWAGIRYGIATLSVPLATAKHLLHIENFQSLSTLGINWTVKWEWWRIHSQTWGIVMLLSEWLYLLAGLFFGLEHENRFLFWRYLCCTCTRSTSLKAICLSWDCHWMGRLTRWLWRMIHHPCSDD